MDASGVRRLSGLLGFGASQPCGRFTEENPLGFRPSPHPSHQFTFGSTVIPAILNPKMNRVEGRNGTANHARRNVAKTPAPRQGPKIWLCLDNRFDNLTTYGPPKCP